MIQPPSPYFRSAYGRLAGDFKSGGLLKPAKASDSFLARLCGGDRQARGQKQERHVERGEGDLVTDHLPEGDQERADEEQRLPAPPGRSRRSTTTPTRTTSVWNR